MAGQSDQDISLMPVAGWAAFLTGLGLHIWGWFFDTTVATGASAYVYVADRTHNIGLISTQVGILTSGGALALLGAVLLVGFGIRREIRSLRPEARQPDLE